MSERPEGSTRRANQTALEAFGESALDSFRYSLIQAPLTGAAQLIDQLSGTNYERNVQFWRPPSQNHRLGSAEWLGEVVGGTIGSALPFIAMYRLAGPGAAVRLETSAAYGLRAQAMPHIAKSMLTGFVYDGVFTPVQDNQRENFWRQRGINALVGMSTFGALTTASIGLKSTGARILSHDIVAGGLSGLPAGLLNAEVSSLLNTGYRPNDEERMRAMSTFALGGTLLGVGNTVHERFFPSTGMRGVRTFEDMVRLADATRVEGHVPPGRAVRANGSTEHVEFFANLRAELERTGWPQSTQDIAYRAFQDLFDSMSALQPYGIGKAAIHPSAVEPPVSPTGRLRLTIIGSTRLGPDTFEYHKIRYIAGRLSRYYDVITGGGPGIMEAANRGALEAGGNSFGIALELPYEQSANRYLTIEMNHDGFAIRQLTLRDTDAIIAARGGVGTAYEAVEKITHIQTGKERPLPIFFLGRSLWRGFDNMLRLMQREGTISPRDRSLYSVTDNVDRMINQLISLAEQRQAGQGSNLAQVLNGETAGGRLVVPMPSETSVR